MKDDRYLSRIKPMSKLLLHNDEFIVLDVETTGFSPTKGGFLIEIGAVKIKNGEIIDRFEELIDPEINIPEKITEITGITNDDVEGKDDYRKVLLRFYKFIGTSIIVGHNVKFDWDRFLLHYFKEIARFPKNYTIDTQLLSKYIDGAKKDKHNLAYLTKKYKLELANHHRAYDDALATSKLLLLYKDILKKDDGVIREQLSVFDLTNKPKDEKVYTNDVQKNEFSNFKLKKINFWQKKNSKRVLKTRLYIILDLGIVYYDLDLKSWGNKNIKETIDFKELEYRILSSPIRLKDLKDKIPKGMLMDMFDISEKELSKYEKNKKEKFNRNNRNPKKELPEDYEINSINYWSKNSLKRIYLNLTVGTVYFNINSKSWGTKSLKKEIDFKELENKVFSILKINNIEDLCSYRKNIKL